MPEKNNYFLRLRAKVTLKGHWQTALLVLIAASLLGWISQAVSLIQGNTLRQQLLGALMQADAATLANPGFWKQALALQFGPERLLSNLLALASWLVAPMFTLGAINYFLQLLRGNKEQSWTVIFSRANIWLKGLGTTLLVLGRLLLWALPGLAVLVAVMWITLSVESLGGFAASWLVTMSIVGYIGMLIPMIRASFTYAMSMHFQADHPDWRCRDCVNASKTMMQGQRLNLFMMYISFIGWQLMIGLVSDMVMMLLGQLFYLIINLGLGLALSVYQNCSICAFYEAWREPVTGDDPLREAGENSTVI